MANSDGKLPTCELMQKRWPSRALCPNWRALCRNEVEIQDHRLIHCSFTSCLWFRALEEMSLVWIVPRPSRANCNISWMRTWQKGYNDLDGDISLYLLVSVVGVE